MDPARKQVGLLVIHRLVRRHGLHQQNKLPLVFFKTSLGNFISTLFDFNLEIALLAWCTDLIVGFFPMLETIQAS